MSRCSSNIPSDSCSTPLRVRPRQQDPSDAWPHPCLVAGQQHATDLRLLSAPLFNFTVLVEWKQFSGCFPISLILQQTVLRAWKGSACMFKETQAWQVLLGLHYCDGDVLAFAFPLFLKLLYRVLYCIWWEALKGFCSEVVLEGSLHTAMLFLTLTLQLLLSIVKLCNRQFSILLPGLLLVHSCGWISLLKIIAVSGFPCLKWTKIIKDGLCSKNTECSITSCMAPKNTLYVNQSRKYLRNNIWKVRSSVAQEEIWTGYEEKVLYAKSSETTEQVV